MFLALISFRGLVDHSGAGRTKSLKVNDPIRNRTRDLPDCSAVPKSLRTLRRRRLRCIIDTKYEFKTSSFDILDPKSAACSGINWLIFSYSKGKVKRTLVQALRLCTRRAAHRGSRGIALPFHDHDTRRWWGVSVTPQPLFTPGKDPVPIVQDAVWSPGPVWTGAENFASLGFDSRIVQPVTSRYTDWATRPTE